MHALVPWSIRWYVQPRMVREVASPAEARAAVNGLMPSKPDVIKVMVDALPLEAPILGGETLRAIVDEARKHDVRTVAHIGTVADALAAADAGVAAWMHGVYKERLPDELIARFKAAGIPCVATTFVFDDYADICEGKRADLIMVGGNPLIEPKVIDDIRMVMKDGVVLERHPLPGSQPTPPTGTSAGS